MSSQQRNPGDPARRSNAPSPGFDTAAIRTQTARSPHREHSVPVYLTSSFVFDSAEHGRDLFSGDAEGLVYSRYGNPSVDELVEKLCLMEGTEDGVATATGMAAMFGTIAALLSAGDHLVCSRAVFGSTSQMLTRIFPRWGIETTFVPPGDPAAWEAAVRPNTKLFFAETPSNPGLELVDIPAVAEIAHSAGALMVVDNCFATPWLQQPARLGADIVTHSATKFMDGQGRVLGGAILGPAQAIEEVRFFCRQTGPSMSPFNAWVLSKSLETLSIRVDRHCENAEAVAHHLDAHPRVERTRYPFLDSHPQQELARRQMRRGGGLVTIDLPGGEEGAMQFINALRMITRSSNLGDSRSIATHPRTTTHARLAEEERLELGIRPATVRLAIGLENVEDIIADIEQALGKE
ncbi:MAG: O-succinylhomoserine sulfhydrylase [Spirochaetaceae bacterium]|nr:MAG: O-succinylhomoserine sulfhydrylase [Spirochaetaceae bacterium]